MPLQIRSRSSRFLRWWIFFLVPTESLLAVILLGPLSVSSPLEMSISVNLVGDWRCDHRREIWSVVFDFLKMHFSQFSCVLVPHDV